MTETVLDSELQNLVGSGPKPIEPVSWDNVFERALAVCRSALKERDLDLYECRALASYLAKHVLDDRREKRRRPMDTAFEQEVKEKVAPVKTALCRAGFKPGDSLEWRLREFVYKSLGRDRFSWAYSDSRMSDDEVRLFYDRASKFLRKLRLDSDAWCKITTPLWAARIRDLNQSRAKKRSR